MKEWSLTDEDIIDVERAVADVVLDAKDGLLKNNYRFWLIFNKEDGKWARMSRRQFIERYVPIRNKQGIVVPLILNDAQRRLECQILRMERAGVPVRIIILKARQMGFSTYIAGVIFELMLRRSFQRALIIAHRQPTSRLLLQMSKTMLSQILKMDQESRWQFKMESRRTERIRWADPMNSEIEITSAEVAEPGHGDTCQIVHMSETSRWPDAEIKFKGVLQILPTQPETYGFSESTANGDIGYFRDHFYEAWQERELPLNATERSTPWIAMFYPWFYHQEYRWTRTFGLGHEWDPEIEAEIKRTLQPREEWLLKQKYLVRGKGWVNVDYDQLAWRRRAIPALCGNNMTSFDEQYPDAPEVSFAASGSPAFDYQRVRALLDSANEDQPVFVGEPMEAVETAS